MGIWGRLIRLPSQGTQVGKNTLVSDGYVGRKGYHDIDFFISPIEH